MYYSSGACSIFICFLVLIFLFMIFVGAHRRGATWRIRRQAQRDAGRSVDGSVGGGVQGEGERVAAGEANTHAVALFVCFTPCFIHTIILRT